jgi:hypothetical protein
MNRLWVLCFGLLAGSIATARAQGGSPMLTDDPGTPGDGHWEINVALITEHARDGARQSNFPLLDLDYGVGERVQLKYEVPWLVASEPGQPSRAGLGNSEFGVKWRFFDDATSGLAISTYPQIEFNNPTSSKRRGLVDGGTTLVLPFEFQGKLGPLGWNAELGRSFPAHGEGEWLYGLVLGREVNPRLELAVELHGAGRFSREDDELITNVGARLKLSGHQTLLISVGRSVNQAHGEELTFVGYLGMQWTY